MEHPVLETERLILRPFTLDDVPEITRMAGNPAIADTTRNIPHPYSEQDARDWISTHRPRFEAGELLNFAVQHRDGRLLGAVGLVIGRADRRAELGYWVGKEHWNLGYATESSGAVLRHGFEVLGLRRIYASHLTRNPASGRVMEKLGMVREGVLRKHIMQGGRPEDISYWGILSDER